MRFNIVLLVCLVAGCAGLPDYAEPPTDTPSSKLLFKHDFEAPFLGYSTFVNVHTEEEPCGKSFGSDSGARLVVLDKGNPLISELNPDGVRLSIDKKYTFMILSVAGPINCAIYTSFSPKANESYEIKVSGELHSFSRSCKAELFKADENTKQLSPVEFEYYGNCHESAE